MRNTKSRLRVYSVALISLAMALAGIAGTQDKALASGPAYECTDPHCYSTGVAQNSYYGAYDVFTDNALTMPSSEVENLGHISNEMWFITKSDGTRWVEIGVARGCTKLAPTGTCSSLGGQSQYMQFWAEPDSSGHFHFHVITANSSRDGNQHRYEIFNSGYPVANDTFDIILDGNVITTTSYQDVTTGTAVPSRNGAIFSSGDK